MDFKKVVFDISYGIPEVRLTDGFNAGAYLNKNADSSENFSNKSRYGKNIMLSTTLMKTKNFK